MAEDFEINRNPILNASSLNKTTIISTGTNLAQELIRAYNLRNVNILPQPKNNYQISKASTVDAPLYLSALGTPILADLTFFGDTYTDDFGNEVSFDTLRLETVLITLNQTKNIVRTPIQGRPGTVKEYVAMGDYMVKIDGILTNVNGSYPKDQLSDLKNMLIAPVSIAVTSWYLQLFDIDYIMIDGYDIAQVEGGYSQQPFSIAASSDREVNLIAGQ